MLLEIYEKLIVEEWGHLQTAQWLKKEHQLDLLGKDADGKVFSNYLAKYGHIKIARESYKASAKVDSAHIASNWYELLVQNKAQEEGAQPPENETAVNAVDVENKKTSLPEKPQTSVETARSTNLADQYRVNKVDKPKVTDPLDGYDEHSNNTL